jgi:hypothetical protein
MAPVVAFAGSNVLSATTLRASNPLKHRAAKQVSGSGLLPQAPYPVFCCWGDLPNAAVNMKTVNPY